MWPIVYIYIYILKRISIGYMLFSVITLVYVHHFAWYLVISRKVVLVVCGRKIKNLWLNPFFFIKVRNYLIYCIAYSSRALVLESCRVWSTPSLSLLLIQSSRTYQGPIYESNRSLHIWWAIFVSLSHQTGLDTRSMTWWSIIVGI